MRSVFGILTLISTMFLSGYALAVGVDELQLQDPAKEAMAREEFKKYRCLVCQNQSIEDSDAGLAADLRAIIREQIQTDKTPEEIQTFLVSRYGDWVLLTPRFSGLSILLWLFPIFLLVLGGLFAVFAFRRKQVDEVVEPVALSPEEKKRIEQFRS